MTFKRVANQMFDNSEGFRVQTGSRESMEYIEGTRKATVAVEFGTPSVNMI